MMHSIKFLHCADLHIDSPFYGLHTLPNNILKKVRASTFESLRKVVQTALDEEVDFVLIAGDLFDGENRSIYAQAKLREQFLQLQEANIHVYVIHGNHDHLEGNTSTSFQYPNNVHIFPAEVTSFPFYKHNQHVANIYGFSYPTRHHYENRVDEYVKEEDVPFHIGMIHGNLAGREEHDPYAPFTVQQLLSKQFNYWALGHIHKREILYSNPYIVYPGNIQGRHKKEEGTKGCYVMTMSEEKTELQFFKTETVLWDTTFINIENMKSIDRIVDAIQDEKRKKRAKHEGVLLQVILQGQGELHSELVQQDNQNDLLVLLNEQEEEDVHFVYTYDLKVQTQPLINKDQLKETPFFIDFFKLVEETSDIDFSALYSHSEARKYLTSLTVEEKQEMKTEAEQWIITKILEEKR
ncbi:metallophosphoesterase family protein [Sutcliffiella cohnii]